MKSIVVKINILILFATMVACSPVHYFTRVKKTPNEYSRNYCCGEVAVPKAMDKSNPWIVYSDRAENTTFYQPGGKVPLKSVSFMEAFVVIGEKGDFLKLVKYQPDNFENGKIKELSKAEYYGWMNKSHLLLSSRAVTDVATGFVIKMITRVKDTIPLSRTEDFFSDNSIVLFQEPELLTPIGKIPFQQPLFLAKKSSDKSKCFVVGKEQFSPENATSMVAGWISTSLLMPLGEYLYWNYKNIPYKNYVLGGEKNIVDFDLMGNVVEAQELPNFDGLNPIYSIHNCEDSLACIRTTLPIPLLDDKRNTVFSLSGDPITRPLYDNLLEKKKQINVLLLFADQRQVFDRMGPLVSSFQSLNGVLKKYASESVVRLGYLIGYEDEKSGVGRCQLSTEIDSVLYSLEQCADNQEKQSITFSGDAWKMLRKSFPMLQSHKNETNVLVLIGENGNMKSQVETSVIDKLIEFDCRIVGCQIYSNQGNSFNNFVLQVEDMITRSSNKLSQKKRSILVHSEQLNYNNQYREISENIYALDYPRNSMWQGWILFPKKKECLPPDMLISVMDSILSEVALDNKNVLEHLYNSFKDVGAGRTFINPTWKKLTGLDSDYEVTPNLFQPISLLNPTTTFPLKIHLNRSDLSKGSYFLFLTENELYRIRKYLSDVTKIRVDYKYSASSNRKKRMMKSCLDLYETNKVTKLDSSFHAYLNTSKARRSMQKAILNWAMDEKIYPKRKKDLKKMSLSQNQQFIFSYPSFNRLLGAYELKDLRKKKIIIDREFDELQEYYLYKQKMLEDAIVGDNRYEFNGQVYYLIKSDCLP